MVYRMNSCNSIYLWKVNTTSTHLSCIGFYWFHIISSLVCSRQRLLQKLHTSTNISIWQCTEYISCHCGNLSSPWHLLWFGCDVIIYEGYRFSCCNCLLKSRGIRVMRCALVKKRCSTINRLPLKKSQYHNLDSVVVGSAGSYYKQNTIRLL